MADYLYAVETGLGVVRRADASILAARKWARQAFGVGPRNVTRYWEYRRCDTCDSAPCCCEERHR